MQTKIKQNPLLWLLLLLTAWACLAVPDWGQKTASGQNSWAESASGEMTGREAAPRLGFGGLAEEWASGALVLAKSVAAAETKGGVYLLRDAEGNVVRTGRSNDLVRRAGEHGRDDVLSKYQFEPVHGTDSYAEQRGLEQVLHDTYNPPLNFKRPIDPANKNFDTYMQAAKDFLEGK